MQTYRIKQRAENENFCASFFIFFSFAIFMFMLAVWTLDEQRGLFVGGSCIFLNLTILRFWLLKNKTLKPQWLGKNK
jgi:hypothetical protein